MYARRRNMKKFLAEFKAFALKGNVLQLAIGVIIGGAFQSVISSLTENILSPIIGLFASKNFDELFFEIPFPLRDTSVVIKYGAFFTAVINFLILALVVFLIMRGVNRLMDIGKKPEAPAAEPRKCPYCLSVVDEKATRCPACTSALKEVQAG